MARIGGILNLKFNGASQYCKGDFTLNMGAVKRVPVMGSDGLNHGDTETAQAGKLSGKITHRMDVDVVALVNMTGATVIYTAPNGLSYLLHNARYTGDGNISSTEGEIDLELSADAIEPL